MTYIRLLITQAFWKHFVPGSKRHLRMRKLRWIDGWFTYMESRSPYAARALERARSATYVQHLAGSHGGLPRQGMGYVVPQGNAAIWEASNEPR